MKKYKPLIVVWYGNTGRKIGDYEVDYYERSVVLGDFCLVKL